MKKAVLLPFLLFALLLFMACRLDSHTTFKTPESGTLEISWAMTDDEENIIKQATQMSAQQLCDQFKEKTDAPNAKVEFTKKGKEKICKVSVNFDSIAQLKKFYGEDVAVNYIGEKNGKFYYDVNLSSSNGADASALGLNLQSTWRVTMPGKVISNNGDELHGQTVVWKVPVSGGSKHLVAVSKTGGASGMMLLAIVCVAALLVVLVIVALVWWFVLRGKKTNAPDASASQDDMGEPLG